MKKVLAIAMVFSLFVLNVSATSTPTYEAETSLDMATVQQVYSEEYIAVTELQRELIYADMKQQLLAQDGMYMYPVFKDAIDRQFNLAYYPLAATSDTWYAPNGAWVNYGNSSFDMEIVYMDEVSTTKLYNYRTDPERLAQQDILRTLFSELLGDYGGQMFDLACELSDLAEDISWSIIQNGSGCAMYMESTDYGNGSTLKLLQHWSNAPYIPVPQSAFYDYVDYNIK